MHIRQRFLCLQDPANYKHVPSQVLVSSIFAKQWVGMFTRLGGAGVAGLPFLCPQTPSSICSWLTLLAAIVAALDSVLQLSSWPSGQGGRSL